MSDLRPAYHYPRPLIGVTRPSATTPPTYRTCATCQAIHRGIDAALRIGDNDTANRLRVELNEHQQTTSHKSAAR